MTLGEVLPNMCGDGSKGKRKVEALTHQIRCESYTSALWRCRNCWMDFKVEETFEQNLFSPPILIKPLSLWAGKADFSLECSGSSEFYVGRLPYGQMWIVEQSGGGQWLLPHCRDNLGFKHLRFGVKVAQVLNMLESSVIQSFWSSQADPLWDNLYLLFPPSLCW